ncbi:hypothetical protein OV090_43580 [Nannocystis sp. RBIL2]|uniref:hypothetical protein n=1 Tax=Nannocystis sp. RBIL2 TaxID=2996788 RepID=UPI00226E8C8A|nr:hypothetical protein [Nannocystis sp. RBIL2]MCY1071706.1 hypothetical protein [Nannocystis sp. RBIL2]
MDYRDLVWCPNPPTQAVLDAALAGTTRVRVRLGPSGAHGLFAEVADAAELAALRAALPIVEEPALSCLCRGGPLIELLAADDRQIAALNVHVKRKLRTDLWDGDAPLRDPAAIWRWFDRLGVSAELARGDAELDRMVAALFED